MTDDPDELLVAIYLDAFKSGACTAATTVLAQGAAPTPAVATAALHLTERMMAAIAADPLTQEEIRNEIRERIAGVDSGPKGYGIPWAHGGAS